MNILEQAGGRSILIEKAIGCACLNHAPILQVPNHIGVFHHVEVVSNKDDSALVSGNDLPEIRS